MNNTLGTSDIPLTVFGGAVTEMAPEDLPEGASPLNQDVDYTPGATFTRAGRKNQYVYGNFFAEKLAGFGSSNPGDFDPDETAWINPNNITVNSPPTYAEVTLNAQIVAVNGLGPFDKSSVGNSPLPGQPVTSCPALNPTSNNSWVFAIAVAGTGGSFNPSIVTLDPPFTQIPIPPGGFQQGEAIINPAAPFAGTGTNTNAPGVSTSWAMAQAIFALYGPSFPTLVQFGAGTSGSVNPGATATFGAPTVNGNTIIGFLFGRGFGGQNWTVSDNAAGGSNVYTVIDSSSGTGFLASCEVTIFIAENAKPATQLTLGGGAGGSASFINAVEYAVGALSPAANPNVSQELRALNFGNSIPPTSKVLGMQIEVSGKQSTLAPAAMLTARFENAGSDSHVFQLPLSDGTVTLGVPTDTWGLALTPDDLNSPDLTVTIVASALDGTIVTFDISAVKLKVWLSPSPPGNNNWIATYEQDNGDVDTLLLDDQGILWDESVNTAPGILNAIFTAIEPNTFAKGVTFLDVEWFALSNLLNGTDMPRQWDGTNLDRVSQVGPGAPPAVSTSGSTINIVSITQATAKSDPEFPNHLSGILWSAGAGNSGPGNVVTVYYARTSAQAQDPDLVPGRGVELAGVDTANPNNQFNGHPLNGDYIVTGVGSGIPPGGEFARWYFTIQVDVSQFVNQANHEEGHGPDGTYQVTEATLTAASQVPNLEVGNQMTLAGTGGAPTAGYDGTWTVDETPNASQLQIVSVARSAGIATYAFNLISGTAPVVGQFVTVVGTLADNQSFNVSNQAIASTSPGSFSLALPGNDVSPTGENGSGTISGTIFKFDPLKIVGTRLGGTIVTVGVIGAGIRRAVVIFETRSEGLTQPSPYVEFTVTGSVSTINVSQVPIGPPDTIRRIIAFTGAGGGNYFYIDQPVTVTDNGQKVTYTSTIIPDNTSTSATFSFPDAILLAGIAIDVQGNNLFAQRELGSSLGLLSYSSRLFAWGEQNKVQNFLNLSFDGGYIPPLATATPLGWTVDATNGVGGVLQVSPQFGDSYYIRNATGSPQALYGMIEQNAFANQLGTPIIRSSTKYSVRITARSPAAAASGSLVVDLFSPQLAQIFGSFSVPLADMGTTMEIFTGELITQAQQFGTVPKDLLLRVYAANIPNGGDVEIDRLEPFTTDEPVFATSFTASYASNPQAFDGITGNTGPNQNQQPIRGGATMFDLLFALKSGSIYSTSDNGVTEPAFWSWREVSQKVGTIGINSYDYGEDWLVTACRPGIYFFNGGTPIKVSQEVQTVWDTINWEAGPSIWLRNDVTNKRILCGIPLPTGPGTKSYPFLPELPPNAAPTSPNVILAISYRELNSGMQFAETGPIKSSYSGRILSPEPARKSSWWNIKSPYADFINRGDDDTPLFLCTGYGDSKVFALDPDELADDGTEAINGFYFTYGFTKPEVGGQSGLGMHRMSLGYLTTLATGIGDLEVWVYTDSTQDPEPFRLDSIPLDLISLGDLESDANLTGNRFFIRYGTNAVGAKFRLSKVVASLAPDAWSAIRGTASGG